ncbi:MAG TPA: peptide-methionine (S)-S-oxide reductase MsrA [Rhodocyclaceae bacterium]|nr:peptide-methionine (S)-S-oxide reductase MsrA [Rhodocyclaceae bacterium]
MEAAIFGGGCFWCLEAVFERVRGVASVVSGYCGGAAGEANYAAVCSGQTAHAEVVKITFDACVIRYDQLLRLFFTIHDPTTLNRQGNDVGPQYRSAVFCQSDEQSRLVHEVIAEISKDGWWPTPIVTEIHQREPFYAAEAYHQGYFRRNPDQGYCAFVVAPKVAKARAEYAAYFGDVD